MCNALDLPTSCKESAENRFNVKTTSTTWKNQTIFPHITVGFLLSSVASRRAVRFRVRHRACDHTELAEGAAARRVAVWSLCGRRWLLRGKVALWVDGSLAMVHFFKLSHFVRFDSPYFPTIFIQTSQFDLRRFTR